MDEAIFCGIGSCDNTPGHDGIHRCRCGTPVDAPANGCEWHQAPKPMTAEALMAYLYDTADFYPIEERFVMIGDSLIVSMNLKNRRVTLLGDKHLSTGEVAKAPVTGTMLIAYLELATTGLFHEVLTEPVMIGENELVHATIVDDHVVLQSTLDMNCV